LPMANGVICVDAGVPNPFVLRRRTAAQFHPRGDALVVR
jgi:hypothetical protein